MRVTTNYRIDDESSTVDDELEALLYEGMKPYLAETVTLDEFKTIHVLNSQKVGPSVADDVKRAAVWAIFFSLIIIGLYILLRFRNISYSMGALASIAHDVLLIIGIYSLFYNILPFSLEIDQTFIAAILTIIGYSVNDTVVIFDRVREMVGFYPKRNKKRLLNESMNMTLIRTFSTSLSTLVVLLAIFLFGGDTIRGFAFAMLVGVITGTYSTLFIAAPVAYDIQKKQLGIHDEDHEDEK